MEMTWKWPGKLLPIEHLWEIEQMNNDLMFLCECGCDTPHFQWPKRKKKNVRPPRTFLFITFLLHACYITAVLSALCNPVDCSPPGSSVHGISQARILQWVVISFSRAPSWCLTFFPRQEYCSGLSFPSPGHLPDPWPSFPGKNTAVGCHFLLQGTFLAPDLPSQARILQWVVISFPGDLPDLPDQTCVS